MLGFDAKTTSGAGLASKRVAPSLLPVPAHRLTRAAFQPIVSKRSVRVAAAEKDAAAAPKAAATPRAPRPAPTVNLADVKAGDEFEGTVASVAAFGAFVNFGAAKDGLLHVSQFGNFVKNVADVVKVGDKVNVKVLTLDAATGKIALTTQGTQQPEGSKLGGAGRDSEAATSGGRRDFRAEQQQQQQQDDGTYEFDDAATEALPFATVDESDADDGFELDEGQVLVTSDVPGYEAINFVMEDEDEELTDASLAELEAEEDVPVNFENTLPPYLTRVEGKVKRVEEYGVFVEFEFNGKNLTGLLAKDEMKVPYEKLDANDKEDARIMALVEAGQTQGEDEELEILEDDSTEVLPPEYVDVGDEFDITSYYNVGDSVAALILDGGLEDGKIALTHFTDADIETDAIQVELEADEYDEDEVDPLAEDVEALLVEPAEVEAAEAEAARLARGPRRRRDDDEPEVAVPTAVVDTDEAQMYSQKLNSAVALNAGSLLFSDPNKRDAVPKPISPMAFPSRPLGKADMNLAPLNFTEIDFDGDEVELSDVWDEPETQAALPKDVLKRLGYKMIVGADGAVDIVQREKPEAKEGEDSAGFEHSWSVLEQSSLEKRVASWVADLTDPEEEEAEVPARALRRPRVFAASVSAPISATLVKSLRDKTGAGMMDCKKALAENEGDVDKSIEWLRKKGIMGADKKAGRLAAEGAVTQYIHPGSRLGVLLEVNSETDFVAASEKFQSLIGEIGMIICASPDVRVVAPADVPEDVLAKEREVQMNLDDLKTRPENVRSKIVEGRLEKIKNQMALLNQPSLRDNSKTVADIVKETIASVGENIQIRRFVKYQLGEGLEKRSNDFAAEVAQQTQAKAADKPKPPPAPAAEAKQEEAKPTVQVSAKVVKQLRDKTGAGMMDCKKALGETGGDEEKAIEWLRIKGLAGADKKAGRLAAEGVIASYIHPGSRLGVLLEVNCETDFVAGSEKFQNLVNGIAMQIAASREVAYVSAEDIPAEVFEREKQIEMGREDLKSKPEAIRAKIAEGRAKKIAAEMALLDQPYLMDQSKTVAEAVKEAIASIGEKISVRRFVKYTLGEGLEKRSNDFAAEVAAVTGPKA